MASVNRVKRNPRCCAWQHEDGKDATHRAIAESLAPFLAILIEKHVDIYSSSNMKTGVDVDGILSIGSIMKGFIDLDSRGGVVSQNDMASELIAALKKADKVQAMLDKKTPNMTSAEEVISMTAFLLRVSLAHLRSLYDSCANLDTHPLADLFSMITRLSIERSDQLRSTARRESRMGARPHPFINFRSADDENKSKDKDKDLEDEDDEEPHTFISAFYDPAARVARMLLLDS